MCPLRIERFVYDKLSVESSNGVPDYLSYTIDYKTGQKMETLYALNMS